MIKRICFILEELCHFFIKRLLTWTLDNGHLDNSINMECFQQVWKHQDLDSFAKVGTFTSENNFPLDSSPLNCTQASGERYPIWFNSIFEFCQKMIHSIFDSILLYPRFNLKYYSIQNKLWWFNSKYYSIQNIIQFKKKFYWFNSKDNSIQ